MQGKQYIQMLDDKLAASGKARHSASKYDFVKVKVWVGENLAHYYVLSRFLISRMLTVTKIPQMKAVKIALEVKKHLVDNDFMDISQEHFEAILFNVMRARGFEDDYVERYKMVTKFFQQRRPLIVLICGVPCTGKSTLAQQLASRLNMPNVLQTDAIYELMRMSEDGPLQPTPLWDREDLSPGGLVREFLRECRIVRKGLDGSLFKCISDGKSIIMEGMHLDPSLYLYEFARSGQAHLRNSCFRSGDSFPAAAAHPESASSPLEEGATFSNGVPDTKEESDLLRVSTRAVSADEQLLSQRGGRRVRLPARRSASFMLSPGLAVGCMSPVLAHAAELHTHAPIAGGGLLRHPELGSAREQPISAAHRRPSGDESAASNAFLSMSPTMQWLQVASRTGSTDIGLSPGTRSGASPAPLAEEDLKPGPVFVPIVLCMDDSDHELLVQEWHACHAGPARDGEASAQSQKRNSQEESTGHLTPPIRDLERPSRTVGLQHGQSTLTGGVKNATHRYDLPPPPLAVRNLVQQAQFAHLCTVMSGMHHRRAGYPFGTLVDFAADEAGYPIFCLSPLAIHTRNIMEDPRCSLVVQMPGWTGLANARVTIFGDVYQLPQHLQEPARDIFLHKQATEKKNRWVSGNFMFFRMHHISDIYFVGGFGTVQWVDVGEYVSAKPDEIVTSDSHHTLQVLNETHSEGLRQALSRPGSAVDDAAFISIDRLGADVRVRRATDYIVERLTFPTHVHTLEDALTAMQHLLEGHSLSQRV
ncbi:hypothetical protein WJX75_007283 [Coccomyxa subellipsoidea]|uniref:CREG-like beta-barrel domain-containing protein n=1 Tax=Coccomyxa subellipsoidea TaxID=248742 RepID=A0ABR2YRU3_9CHLO